MKKFASISYVEYTCPCCGMKKFSEVRDDEIKEYCSRKHISVEMKKRYKTEVSR